MVIILTTRRADSEQLNSLFSIGFVSSSVYYEADLYTGIHGASPCRSRKAAQSLQHQCVLHVTHSNLCSRASSEESVTAKPSVAELMSK